MKAECEAISKAYAYIQDRLDRHELQSGDKLPTIKMLARAARVSVLSMSKALASFKAQGIIEGVRGHSFYVCSRNEQAVPESKSLGWEQIRDSLKQNLLSQSGDSASGLASLKELAHDFGCTYPTIRKVVVSLVQEGLLKKKGRGYEIIRSSLAPAAATVVVFAPRTRRGQMRKTFGGHNNEVVRSLEVACSDMRMRLRIVLFDPEDESGRLTIYGTDKTYVFRDDPAILGYVLIAAVINEQFRTLSRKLSSFKKPLAVIDEVGEWRIGNYIPSTLPCLIYPLGISPSCGRDVSHYFLELGHRHILFVTVYNNYWSKLRFASVREEYAAAGFGSAVDELYCPVRVGYSTLIEEPVYRRLVELSNAITGEQFTRTQLADQLDSFASRASMMKRMAEIMEPMLDKALASKQYSAIIAANDEVGMYVSGYLRRKNIAVPTRYSLLSFDDSLDATHSNMTSYNFNIDAIVRNALSFLSGRIKTRGPKIVEIAGKIVRRGSTALV